MGGREILAEHSALQVSSLTARLSLCLVGEASLQPQFAPDGSCGILEMISSRFLAKRLLQICSSDFVLTPP